MRLDFHPTHPRPPTRVRIGRALGGWAAVGEDGTLLALTPTRRATLALARRLGLGPTPGEPRAIRRAEARGTPFQIRVWIACRAIHPGSTCTYGQLARRIACASPRAVGQALGRNPLWQLIPCHRVVAADGTGGFAWGASLKRRWLRSERA